MNDMKQHLQQVLENEIPLTTAIGVTVDKVTNSDIILIAPLENNINHKCTAFGGSLYSIAVLAGWSLIYTRLKTLELQAHIVIQKSNIQYLNPVVLDIKAMCSIDSEEIFNNFLLTFKKKSIARIKLKVEIPGNDEPDVIFTGQYVIHR